MTVPRSKLAQRIFFGLMPDYYHKVKFAYPDDVTEILTLIGWNYTINAEDIKAVIKITYVDATKKRTLEVERTDTTGEDNEDRV